MAYFDTGNLSGAPKDFTLGLVGGTGTTRLARLGTGSPLAGIPEDDFSLRMTGTLTFPTAGDYQFRTVLNDGGKLFLNDELLIHDTTSDGSAYVSPIITGVAAGERRHIRVISTSTSRWQDSPCSGRSTGRLHRHPGFGSDAGHGWPPAARSMTLSRPAPGCRAIWSPC
ncbi:MAG: PA14 domain-containing protein [Schumannella sp.]